MPKANASNIAAKAEAPVDCNLCPRLVSYRRANQTAHPDWFNAPVPSFGGLDASLLIIGLAPGVTGANRTGRPFTGDYAGELLFSTLLKHGWAKGTYAGRKDDGLELVDCRISNAVRCVPPENKPTPAEAGNCRVFLSANLEAMPKLKVIIALGRIAHDNAIRALKLKAADLPFAHAAEHALPRGMALVDSYHCSRYNTNTGRLTVAMFDDVFARARRLMARA
jgi:uracil-DNA glycosylase family 4